VAKRNYHTNWRHIHEDLNLPTDLADWRDERDRDVEARAAARLPRQRVSAKTVNQSHYLKMIETSSLTLCTGPAGTGKTWMACGAAAGMLMDGRVDRLVLTRPLVECGRHMGALPGTSDDKAAPFVRPMLDALGDFIPADVLREMRDDGRIEIVPLELMRGSSIRRAFLLLDEAQNATRTQALMFLTRIDQGTRAVMVGDADQTDLPQSLLHPGPGGTPENSLSYAMRILHDPDIGKVRLGEEDIVRHGIVRTILKQWGRSG
jgi:phosphate starvation-inducible PhoH-like protein